jgi:uncharacterized membrane protein YeaQ/YmgE (transglycosylase-associated protein family)
MFFYYLFGYLVGAVIVYFWLRNQARIASLNDVVITAILSAVIGSVYSFALASAHIKLNEWFLALLSAVVGAIISYKLFEKRKT